MRILHIADLHLGKVIHGLSLLDSGDQPWWIARFLEITEELKPQAVLIAGDVYDRATPSGEAVERLSKLVEGLAARGIPVLMVSGNHDSGQRLAFARNVLAEANVHIAGRVSAVLEHVTLEDEYGPVTFWLMPYLFPALVGHVLGDDSIRDYETAARTLLARQPIDPTVRNILIAHQNVTAGGAEAERGGSEVTVGGVGQIDYSVFDAFDYVALGHIHAACPIGRDAVRYAGSPLCYHFNETKQPRKGPVLVELGPKGSLPKIETLLIPPLHPMRELRGPYEDLLARELNDHAGNEYLRIVLTDQPVTPEAIGAFQSLAESRGSLVLDWDSEFRRFSQPTTGPERETLREKPMEQLFADFFRERNDGETPGEMDLALLEAAGELLRDHPPQEKQRGSVEPALSQELLQLLLKQEGIR